MNFPRQVCAVSAGLMFSLAAAHGESFAPTAATESVSGQFSVSTDGGSAFIFPRPERAGTNDGLLHLNPALLAVSAEHFKNALWPKIGLDLAAPWSGKIFLVLHPARSPDEPARLVIQPFLKKWNYRLELPDVISADRCARALCSVLLLETANRNALTAGRSAAVPDWLVAGMGRQVLNNAETPLLFSAPTKAVNDLPQLRTVEKRRGLDALAGARDTLKNSRALTFDQLSWPTDAQLAGADGGVFFASAQLFVAELLALDGGPKKFRALLSALPAHENWQTAFFDAFHENFRRPLDVEKWWALRVLAFAAHDPGPRWTVAASRERLAAALAVPVTVRYATNALPGYSEISLQAVIRNFTKAEQVEILSRQLNDLQLTELRLAPPLNGLAAGYVKIVSDYLKSQKRIFPFRWIGPATTLQRLDAQDVRRRELEARLAASPLPANLLPPAP
jgi:hypothetical protein